MPGHLKASTRRAWAHKIQGIRPFVLEDTGHIVGYADVQPDGRMEHFYVSGSHARQGIGTLLMNRIHQAAYLQVVKVLTAEVSCTAHPFFQRFGFVVVEKRSLVIRGVAVPNFLMRKELVAVWSKTPVGPPQ